MKGNGRSDEGLQQALDRLRAGEAAARDALIDHACERLRRLTRKLLRGYPVVRRWEQTDDVFQRAVLRLYQSLDTVQPADVRGFVGLAATQIRRELIDLARHYGGPEGIAANHATDTAGRGIPKIDQLEVADDTDGPATLQLWTEFHQQASRLPDEEREVFDLIYYDGLPQSEVARLLGVTERTVKRRWRSAKVWLHDALGGALPTRN